MKENNMAASVKKRIRTGTVTRADVVRRLAELAFGKANDCVKLALEDVQDVAALELSLLSEIRRNGKGTVEIRLVDRLKALELLLQTVQDGGSEAEAFLRALAPEGDGG